MPNRRLPYLALLSAVLLLPCRFAAARAPTEQDPFVRLRIYDGEWAVRATHPWSGAAAGAVDRLSSHCHRFTHYFACEQTINGQPTSLLVYTEGDAPGRLNTRMIAPNGLAGGRGDLTLAGSRWTYIDKPPASLSGNWSRTENVVVDRDHILFKEYESPDEGKTWRLTNSGSEERLVAAFRAR
jgi:hypothetical protein